MASSQHADPDAGPDLGPAENWFGVFRAGQVFVHLSRGFTVEASRQYLAHCDPHNVVAGNAALARRLDLRRPDGGRVLAHSHWRTPDVRRHPAAPALEPTPIPVVTPQTLSWADCEIPVHRDLPRGSLGPHGRLVEDLEVGLVLDGFEPRGVTSTAHADA